MQRSHIGALEAGTRETVTSDVLLRLARALRCSADDLLGTFDEPKLQPAVLAEFGA